MRKEERHPNTRVVMAVVFPISSYGEKATRHREEREDSFTQRSINVSFSPKGDEREGRRRGEEEKKEGERKQGLTAAQNNERR